MKNTLFCILLVITSLVQSCKKDLEVKEIEIITPANEQIGISKLDKFLETTMDSLKIPGLSIALINDSKIVYHRALGVTNIETNQRIDNNSIFEAASLSKPVFAFFTLKMAEKGIIDLDRPLHFYLKDETMEVDSRYKEVNAKMVLNHTTGFPNWRWFEPAPKEMNIQRGDFYMKAEPGTFTYSGEGYQYLARVLAKNNHLNMFEIADLFNEEISKPLNMRHAYFVWDDFLYNHKVYGHKEDKVDGRSWGSGMPHQHSKILNAAGGLHTEANSYANFLIALLNEEGLYDSSFDEMLAEQVQLPKDHRFYVNENTKAWGLGIAIEEKNGNKYYKHGGNNGGFTSGFLISKDSKNGYVFLINCDRGDEFDNALRKLLIK